MDNFVHRPKDYYPAICLALNYAAGGLEIHDWGWLEDSDLWLVNITDQGRYLEGIQLSGYFVRSCFKTVKEGFDTWTNPREILTPEIPAS